MFLSFLGVSHSGPSYFLTLLWISPPLHGGSGVHSPNELLVPNPLSSSTFTGNQAEPSRKQTLISMWAVGPSEKTSLTALWLLLLLQFTALVPASLLGCFASHLLLLSVKQHHLVLLNKFLLLKISQ